MLLEMKLPHLVLVFIMLREAEIHGIVERTVHVAGEDELRTECKRVEDQGGWLKRHVIYQQLADEDVKLRWSLATCDPHPRIFRALVSAVMVLDHHRGGYRLDIWIGQAYPTRKRDAVLVEVWCGIRSRRDEPMQ